MVISACNIHAERLGIQPGLVLADARAIVPNLEVRDEELGMSLNVLEELAAWGIRFTPVVSVDEPDGLLMDVSGCAHLWGGERAYVQAIESRLNARGYDVRVSMADTPGVAWAVARYGEGNLIVRNGHGKERIADLPPEALRLDPDSVSRLHKLGLRRVGQFMNMERHVLRRRFGRQLLDQIDKALGTQLEKVNAITPPKVYEERLSCLEPIVTREGILIGLEKLLLVVCGRLQKEQKGLRSVSLRSYRIDGKIVEIRVGTHKPTHHVTHLMRLFEHKVSSIDPGLGIELFILEAFEVEVNPAEQEQLWEEGAGLGDERLSELIDRMIDKGGIEISSFLPDERYWPERSYRLASSLMELASTAWRTDIPRPVQLLDPPEVIEVSAPIPDYPPMLFVYRGNVHRISRADGPERIEQEWWLQEGQHRDYYLVEDDTGVRFWIFRRGHYHDTDYQWFLHGFFA